EPGGGAARVDGDRVAVTGRRAPPTKPRGRAVELDRVGAELVGETEPRLARIEVVDARGSERLREPRGIETDALRATTHDEDGRSRAPREVRRDCAERVRKV